MIGYYVHHQGWGHLQRARSISRHLEEPPTLLSSLAPPDDANRWVQLPVDNLSSPADHTAHGTLHWVPRHDLGLRRRMAIIADWIDATEPDLMVVDVSVEVAIMCRLMGIPTVVMAMPGDRSDRAHRSAYDSAHAILAPWPAEFSASQWSDRWSDKTFHAGAISRYADRQPPPADRSSLARPACWCCGATAGAAHRPMPSPRRPASHPDFRWRIAGFGDAAGGCRYGTC